MAKVKFIFQRIFSDHLHSVELLKILNMPDITRVIVSVAVVREAGVNIIADKISSLSKFSSFFVGINNGVTSAQGLLRLYNTGVDLFVINTGSAMIFHPKIYLVEDDKHYFAIIGSANLTSMGLIGNIEASSLICISKDEIEEAGCVKDITSRLFALFTEFPENISKITSCRDIIHLLRCGYLEDERKPRLQVIRSGVIEPPKVIPKMFPILNTVKKVNKKQIQRNIRKNQTAQINLNGFCDEPLLLWESKELKERDLNIPHGANTNVTGSMLLKKGNMSDDVDQRHYFRDVVFAGLTWETGYSKQNLQKERAYANFEIAINGISFGQYRLMISHNPRTDTKTYRQKNAMTQLHWSKETSFIKNSNLLNYIMRLYWLPNTDDYIIQLTPE